MSDPESPLPDALRQALKDKAAFTPPETFYTDVLRQVRSAPERRSRWAWLRGLSLWSRGPRPSSHRAGDRSYQRLAAPVRFAVTAAVLMISVYAIRDNPNSPERERAGEATKAKRSMRLNDAGTAIDLNRPENVRMRAGTLFSNPPQSLGEDKAQRENHERMPADLPGPSEADHRALRQSVTTKQALLQSAPARRMDNGKAAEPTAAQNAAPMDFGAMLAQNKEEVAVEAMAGKAKEASSVAAASPLAAGQEIEAQTLKKTLSQRWSGTDSAVSDFRSLVVRTPSEWQALWDQHTQGQPVGKPLPPVNFDDSIVIALFAGWRPELAGIEITEVTTLPGEVLVRFREVAAPEDQNTATRLSRPFDLRVIPKTELPIRFKKNEG